MLWLGLAYHKEYSMMKMSLEHHKETLQYLIWVDLLQGLKQSAYHQFSFEIQFLAPLRSSMNVIDHCFQEE